MLNRRLAPAIKGAAALISEHKRLAAMLSHYGRTMRSERYSGSWQGMHATGFPCGPKKPSTQAAQDRARALSGAANTTSYSSGRAQRCTTSV